MKKLILAPAVALAFTGLVAAPVAAAEVPSTQSDSAETKAEKLAKEKKAEQAKADKLAKEKAAEEKAAKEKKAKAAEAAEKKAEAKKAAAKEAAEEAAEKAADKKKANEEDGDDADKSKKPAPEDGDDKGSKKDNGSESKDSDAKDDDKNAKDSEEPKDEVENINASLRVATSSISAEDLASDGVKVTVTGLEKGDKLTTSGLTAPATTVTADGSKSITLDYSGDAEDLKEGKKSFAVKVQREGVAAQTLSGSTNVMDTQAAIDSEVTVDPEEITPEDLADPNKGIQVAVTNLEEGDTVTDSLTNEPNTVDADGVFSFNVYYEGPAEDLEEGPVPFTVTIDREGEESVTLDDEINVVDEVAEIDPKVSLATDEISEDDFSEKGIKVTGEGFTPGGTVNLVGNAPQTQFYQDEVTADEDGKISATVKAPEGNLSPGEYSVSAVDAETEEVSNYAKFTVTEDDVIDPIDASLTVEPEEITAEDLADPEKGVTVTVSGVKAGDRITDSLTGETATVGVDGSHELHLYYKGNPDSLEEGKLPVSVTIAREGTESETLSGNINIVAEDGSDGGNGGDDGKDGDTPEAPADAAFSVSPKVLEAADFANEKKGVTLAVENCEPGADVHFAVTPKGIQVTAYENTVKADDEGKASVNVFGTSDDLSAYVGSYTASANCGDDTMKESFKVTEGANGGGSDDGNGGGDDGSQLPRTGADLGGLASGAILLLVGGAAIAVTGRRKKAGQSPSDF